MSTRPHVVVARRIFPALIDELKTSYDVQSNQEDVAPTPELMSAWLANADGVLLSAGERIDEDLLARAPRLEAVCNIAVGYNNIDLAACTRFGVLATNTPDVLNDATADHAWALLLAAARRVSESERWLRDGQWKRWTFDMFLGADFSGTTLGILGMGRIGRAIARRGRGFSMRIAYHNRTRLSPEQEEGAVWMPKEQLLREADHLIVMVPYAPETQHLIDAAELALMKPTAVLVNIARGGVVDDDALIAALRERRIAAAGLDVFENEPKLRPGFLELENVVLTPHIASATTRTREAMARLAMRNLAEILAGRRPPNLLNPEAWDNARARGAAG
ncbi:MAG TPA: D-glycerate dehydrogenase [Burkholderiaceae bacterium]|nr:D-glycerate dehydrogenase [Burkholderiaceae bacterium]